MVTRLVALQVTSLRVLRNLPFQEQQLEQQLCFFFFRVSLPRTYSYEHVCGFALKVSSYKTRSAFDAA